MLTRNHARVQEIVPKGLEAFKQFVNWKLVGDDKVPCSPGGSKIDAHDPVNWLSAEQAAASPHHIAFVLSEIDPFFCIDLDDAWNGSTWSANAILIMGMFPGAAVEVSWSRAGLHIFGSFAPGSIPPDHKTKNNRTGAGVELYTKLRFIALTGLSKQGDALTEHGAAVRAVIAQYGLDATPTEAPALDAVGDCPAPGYTGPEDDGELLRAMQAARGSIASIMGDAPRAWDLYTANTGPLTKRFPAGAPRGDGCTFDRSEADASLMSHLAYWTGKHRSRMNRIFQQSALWRPDHYAGVYAYRLGNILDLAISKCTKIYDKPKTSAPMPSGSSSSFMTTDNQAGFFAGCVYVIDRHEIFTPNYGLLDAQRFRAVYGGYEFQMQQDGARSTRNAFEAFTENRMAKYPKVSRAVFRPDGSSVPDTVNTYRAAVIDEHTGDVSPFLDHLARLLPDPRDRKILLTYMQAVVQYPGVKFQWAPVIQGVEGNGKTFLIRAVAHAIGDGLSYNPKASQLTEKFNSWLEGKLFIGVEEIKIPEHRREMIEDLKEWITNDRVEIRHVGGTKTMSENFANWILTTNHQDAVPISKNARRFCMLFTAQQEIEDLARDLMTTDYFVTLYQWFNRGGGKQAISYFLRHSAIDPEFNPALTCMRAPKTQATATAIHASLGRVEQEILEAVSNGDIGFKHGWISSAMLSRMIRDRHLPNMSPGRIRTILLSMGYKHVCKSAKMLMTEDGARPHIWRFGREDGTIDDYLSAQAS